MIAGIAERLFAGLNPKISQKIGVGLDGVSLVIVICCVNQLKPEIIPNRSNDHLIYTEKEHFCFRVSQSFD